MAGYRFHVFLLVLLAGTLVLAFSVGRDMRQPNYESEIEGQMGRSPAYGSFAPNPNFKDGMTLRSPVAGTIAQGHLPLPYKATPDDALRAGLELHSPLTLTVSGPSAVGLTGSPTGQGPFLAVSALYAASTRDETHLHRGRVVFENFCQVCHGPFGLGDGPVTQGGFPPPPSLLAERAVRMPEGQMFHVLTYGQGRMPTVAPQLSREDRWCAILHVRQLQHYRLSPGQQSPATFTEVAQLYRQHCSLCHGEDGTGRERRKGLPNIPDFTDLAWQTAQTEMDIVNQIDYGSQILMPAFRYKLRRDEIVGLAVYVRSFPSRLAGRPMPLTHLSPVQVYQTYCFACHDTTGQGDPFWRKLAPELPDFTSPTWQKSRADVNLAQSILLGKGKFMLPMSDKLGNANVQQMVEVVRKFKDGQVIPLATPKSFGPPPSEEVAKLPPDVTPPPDVKPPPGVKPPLDFKDLAPSRELADRIRAGGVIFRQLCMVCHGEDGTGNIQRANLPPIPNFKDPAWQKQKTEAEMRVSILEGKGTLMPANSGRITREQARDLVAFIRAFGPPIVGPPPDTDFERAFIQLQKQFEALERELKKTHNKSGL
jgi:mono/diheme cytochrome c family protein